MSIASGGSPVRLVVRAFRERVDVCELSARHRRCYSVGTFVSLLRSSIARSEWQLYERRPYAYMFSRGPLIGLRVPLPGCAALGQSSLPLSVYSRKLRAGQIR